MMTEQALCIGGPLDGKWRQVTGPDLYSMEPLPALPPLKDAHNVLSSSGEHRRYVIECITTPKKKFYLAIEDGLSLEYATDQLMRKYRP
jgi:hypothetical protein